MTSLYLIDGHNVLYRTFFGLPRLLAPDGTPTNVVLGTARILLKILREEKPSAIAAVFDSPEPTPRHNLYPDYKANRLKVPGSSGTDPGRKGRHRCAGSAKDRGARRGGG